ncbi:MAG: glycosyltransferase [Thermoprotei archaeon]
MDVKAVFAVSSVGLGHVKRELAIASVLVQRVPKLTVDWLAAEPALTFLESKGERVLPVSHRLASLSQAIEDNVDERGLNFLSSMLEASRLAAANFKLIREELGQNSYDLAVQDEFLETLLSKRWDQNWSLAPVKAAVTDYVSLKACTLNPVHRLAAWYATRELRKSFLAQNIRLFADEEDAAGSARDVSWLRETFATVGPIVEQEPPETMEELKRTLYGVEPERRVVVFTAGGTRVGERLLSYAYAKADELSFRLNAEIVVLTGPRISKTLGKTSARTVGFTTDSLRYFKSADCVVSQAGASTLHELACMGAPCVAVPIPAHWEQLANARRFAQKHGFISLPLKELSVERLTSAVSQAIERGCVRETRTNAAEVAASTLAEAALP